MFTLLGTLRSQFFGHIKTWVSFYLFFFLGAGFGVLVAGLSPLENIYGLLVLALIFLYAFGYIYVWAYAWRGLPMETKGFLLALYYSLIFLLGHLGFYRGTQGTLYLENLPAHSFYRYLLALLLGLLCLVPPAQMPPWLRFPDTHYFYGFLGTWVANPGNKLCNFLVTLWARDPGCFKFFGVFHGLMVSLVPLALVMALLFSIFVLRDLGFFLLFLPWLGVSLVYGFFWDYFFCFVQENLGSLGLYVRVDYHGPVKNHGRRWVDVDNHYLSFALLPRAQAEGYTLSELRDLWYPLASTLGLLEKLQENIFFFYFSRFLLSLRLLGFFHLCLWLFPWAGGPAQVSTLVPLWPSRITRLFSAPVYSPQCQSFCTGKTTGAYYLKPSSFPLAEQRSQGAFTTSYGNHSVNGDPGQEKNGEVPVYNTNTSGWGTHENPSEKYSHVQVNGQRGEQFAMPWPEGSTMPRGAFGKIIPGSEKVLEEHGDSGLRKISSSYDLNNPSTHGSLASASSTPGSAPGSDVSSASVDGT